MAEPLSTDPYKGVRDFYPRDWARMEALFGRLREVLQSYGYEEYNASPLERADIYEAKSSEELVSEQTYTFTDRGDRRVTLRPEMTPTLARMVANKRNELVFPLRWFSLPNVFRYERPQRGRLREHYQLNVDLIGVKDAKADGEIIVLAHALLTAFGAKNDDFVIRVNSRGLFNAASDAAGLTKDQSAAYLRLLDRKAKMSAEEYAAARAAITSADPLTLIRNDDPRILDEKQKVLSLIAAFAARGMTNVVFDPTLIRAFVYYTGTVFEIFDTNIANPRSLFGGGRYDNLIGMFSARGGDPIPAVGFGMGDVTLADFLEGHDLLPHAHAAPDIFLGTPSAADLPEAHKVAEQLRAKKLRVFVSLSEKSLGDQVKEADRRGIPYFAAVGADERASGQLRVKRLATGEETMLEVLKVPEFINAGA